MITTLVILAVIGYMLLSPSNTLAALFPTAFSNPDSVNPKTATATKHQIDIVDANLYSHVPSNVKIKNSGTESLSVTSISYGNQNKVPLKDLILKSGETRQITLAKLNGTAGAKYVLHVNSTALSTNSVVAAAKTVILNGPEPANTIAVTPNESDRINQQLQEQLIQQKQQAEIQRLQYEKELRRQEYLQIRQLASTNPLIKGLISDSIRFYIAPFPSYAGPNVGEAVNNVSTMLERNQYLGVNLVRTYNEQEADLRIYWIKNYGSETLGQAIFGSTVYVGLGTESCYGQWQPFDSWTVTKILWHEIGHSVGFKHSASPNNIMYYKIQQSKFITDYAGSITLASGYYQSIPFCGPGSYSYQASSDSSSGFYVYVIPQETNPTDFLSGKSNQLYYPTCSGDNNSSHTSFSGSCTVPQGAQLLFHNKGGLFKSGAITLTLSIMDMNPKDNPDMNWNMEDFQYDQAWLERVRTLHQEFGASYSSN